MHAGQCNVAHRHTTRSHLRDPAPSPELDAALRPAALPGRCSSGMPRPAGIIKLPALRSVLRLKMKLPGRPPPLPPHMRSGVPGGPCANSEGPVLLQSSSVALRLRLLGDLLGGSGMCTVRHPLCGTQACPTQCIYQTGVLSE